MCISLLAGMCEINGGSVRCYWLKSEAKCGSIYWVSPRYLFIGGNVWDKWRECTLLLVEIRGQMWEVSTGGLRGNIGEYIGVCSPIT